jgi:hypothetical protein
VPSVEQNTENIKTGAISGAEYRKHVNWCHRWSRVFTTSANASSVSSICNHLINNWCRQIVKYNTVISLLVIICNFVFVLITGALFFYFCISVNYKVHFIVTSLC